MIRRDVLAAIAERDIKVSLSYRGFFIGRLVSLLFLISVFYYISLTLKEPTYFSYLLVGLAYSSIIRTSVFHLSNAVEREQSEGTIGYFFAGHHSNMEFLIGSSITGMVTCWLELIIFLFIGITLFKAKYHININNILYIISAVFLGTLSLWGVGIFFAGATLVTKKAGYLSWLVTAALVFMGNVFFPVKLLPSWIAWFTVVNPVRYTLDLLRILMTGRPLVIRLDTYYVLVAFAAVTLSTGYLGFKAALARIKKKGTLEHF